MLRQGIRRWITPKRIDENFLKLNPGLFPSRRCGYPKSSSLSMTEGSSREHVQSSVKIDQPPETKNKNFIKKTKICFKNK